MKFLPGFFCLLLSLLAANTTRADLRIVFQVRQDTEKPGRNLQVDPPAKFSREYTLTVTLGETNIVSASPDTIAVYDFDAKRSFWLEVGDKTYREQSLYADIGFRQAELRNRLMLQSVLKAGEIKENPFDTVFLEHLFALRAPESKALVAKNEADVLSYSHGEKPLFSCTAQGRTLTPEETRLFVRFLRHAYPAHPDILAELGKRHTLPAEFDLHRYNMGTDHFHFRLIEAVNVPPSFDAGQLITGFTKSETTLQAVCVAADAMTPDQFEAKCDALVQAAVAEGEAKRYLECLVLFLEYVLSSGRQLPPEFQRFKTQLQAEPSVKTFLGALNPKGKEDAQKAANFFKEHRTKATKGLSVLKIHEANSLTAAGNPRAALELFREALSESPWIVGAWKDFGDLHYDAYEMSLAWQCWDTGRRLHPNQRQFESVNAFERRLVADHPGFF
jgi:hypothetical protein